jgi:predicted nucleic acid-binding protein
VITGYLTDTDVLVDFLRGHPEAVAFVKTPNVKHFPMFPGLEPAYRK